MFRFMRFASLNKPVCISVLVMLFVSTMPFQRVQGQQSFACLRFDVTLGDVGILLVDIYDVLTATSGPIEFEIGLTPGSIETRIYLVPDNIGYTVGTELVSVTGGLVRGELRTAINGTGGSVVELPLTDCGFAVSSAQTLISDGRLNNADLASLVAVYQIDNGYSIWQISTSGQGTASFEVSVEAMVDGLLTLAENERPVLIDHSADGQIEFWVLPTAECMVSYISQDNQTRPYIFNCFQPFIDEANRILDEREAELGL